MHSESADRHCWVAGVQRVIAVMEHANKAGKSKILKRCSLPLTGSRCIDMIITDLCVFDVDRRQGGLTLKQLAPGTQGLYIELTVLTDTLNMTLD